MIKNNWITTSLSERTPQNLCDFTLTINSYPFTPDTFKNNSVRVAREICEQNENVYVMYSGGIDSEYVTKVFLDEGLPITPIMIVTPYNRRELEYAVKFYKERNVKPLIFNYEKKEMFEIMRRKCLEHGYFSYMSALHLDICDKISDKNGNVVTGSGEPFTPPRDPDNPEVVEYTNLCEFEFYVHHHPGNHIGGFFTYDLALHYSMLEEVVYTGDMQLTKSNLYEVPYRPKIFWDKEFYQIFHQLKLNIPKFEVFAPYAQYKSSLLNQQPITFT